MWLSVAEPVEQRAEIGCPCSELLRGPLPHHVGVCWGTVVDWTGVEVKATEWIDLRGATINLDIESNERLAFIIGW